MDEVRSDPGPRGGATWRWRVYSAAVLIVLTVVVVGSALAYDRADPGTRLGGDYPAFYAAGSIARSADRSSLYDAAAQQAAQAGLIDDAGGFLYFAYPPFVAGAYGVISGMDYRWSYVINTALMMLALVGTVLLAQPWLERFRVPTSGLVVTALAFYPLLRAIPGGQNTTLTMLLLVAAARLERAERCFAAGSCAALTLFKPQFGVVLALFILVTRRRRLISGWVVTASALYAVSIPILGWDWPAAWWQQAGGFRARNVAANGSNFVSFPGFVENLTSSTAAISIAIALAAGVVGAVAWLWWRHPNGAIAARYALAGVALVVAAPQTLYYDAGLLLPALVLLIPAGWRLPTVVITVWALTWLQIAASRLGWAPTGILVVAVAAAAVFRLGRLADPSPAPR